MSKILFAGGIVYLTLLLLGVGLFVFSQQSTDQEIENIIQTKDLENQVLWYTKLIKRVGPEQAQEALLVSGLPFTGQTHLLNHTVGDYLYDEFGALGLVLCKDYFLASCYHGFLIKAIGRGGIAEVENVMRSCKEQGSFVVAQCAHAVGHGFLAWVGYARLPEALELCDAMDQELQSFPLFNCHDGVFMENIWAVHEDGSPSLNRWVQPQDPQYPCNDLRIGTEYKIACWANQPSLLYQRYQGDIAMVAKECEKLENEEFKTSCFNGLARQVHPLAQGQVDTTFALCEMFPSLWQDYCVVTIVTSSFSVGDRESPFAICPQVVGEDARESCFDALVGMINVYANTPQEKEIWCKRIKDSGKSKECLGL